MNKTNIFKLLFILVIHFFGSLQAQSDLVSLENIIDTTPLGRDDSVMAYDPNSNSLILFGGFVDSATSLNDTWSWNGSEWSQLIENGSPNSPSKRYGAVMTYDPNSNRLILFGGRSIDEFFNDTWAWDGTQWTQLIANNQPNSPPTKQFANMSYDPNSNQLILFGGFVIGDDFTNDTWAWDGTQWNQLTVDGSVDAPSKRIGSVMTYDANSNSLILFGGRALLGLVNDTWSWNGTQWIQLIANENPNSPPARTNSVMSYSFDIGKTILFGGDPRTNPQSFLNDTWSWNGSSWLLLIPNGNPSSPSARAESVMSYDLHSNQLTLFGGFNSDYLNDTWTFNNSGWTLISEKPFIEDISPNSGSILGGTQVTITGTNFITPLTINFGSVPVLDFEVVSPTQIIATSPAGLAIGTVNVTITNSTGTSEITPTGQFTYLIVSTTTTNLAVSTPTPTVGENVTLQANVNPSLATGTVAFFDGETLLGTKPLVNGVATLVVNFLSKGRHVITARYNGDLNYDPSTSSTILLTVNAANFPSVRWTGVQKVRSYHHHNKYINVLDGQSRNQSIAQVKYLIYRDKSLKQRIGTIQKGSRLHFVDRQIKEGKTYTYYIVGVDGSGNVSAPTVVVIEPDSSSSSYSTCWERLRKVF